MTVLEIIDELGLSATEALRYSTEQLHAMLIAKRAPVVPPSVNATAKFTVRSIRIPLRLESAVDKKARAEGTSLNGVTVKLLTDWVK